MSRTITLTEAQLDALLTSTVQTAVRAALSSQTAAVSKPTPATPAKPEWVSKPCARLVILRTGRAPKEHQLQPSTVAFYVWASKQGARSVKAARKLWPAYAKAQKAAK